ncbi:hypothetical protein NM688_g5670 [Phlebia brevispora]|uniref:Uncharacterized protein n=1 Tax=Phlebia brevispora TaxID=194682 RepID=A0ACC1SRI5_9APHY|nr:hypothetical protein NM688_g5670 [Phlebia brevispora]
MCATSADLEAGRTDRINPGVIYTSVPSTPVTMSNSSANAAAISAYSSELDTAYSVWGALGKQYYLRVARRVANPDITAALVGYEYMITIRYEHEFVWKRKWNAATFLFLVNRYVLLLEIVVQTLPFTPNPFWPRFPPCAFFALMGRAYAVAAFVFLLAMVEVALSLWQDSQIAHHYVNDPVLGSSCFYSFLVSPSEVFHAIAADIVVIVITWWKTYRHVKEASAVGINVGFSATLLQYGTLYFVVFCIVNLIEGLILLIPSFQTADPIDSILNVLPNLVLGRFLINLRQVDSPGPSEASRFSRFSVPNFRMPSLPNIVGNLGETLADAEETFDYGSSERADTDDTCEDCVKVASGSGDIEASTSILDIGEEHIEEITRELA